MSRSPSTRVPTPLYPVDSGLGDIHMIHSLPQTRISSRSSVASIEVSSWTDTMSSRSSTPVPRPFEFAVPPPPHVFNHLQPPPLPLSNTGYTIPTPAFPSFVERGQYTPHLSPTAYVSPSPPPSDLGSISSPRTSKSSSTHPHCSTRRRSERDGRSTRALDTITCQICLQPETVCTCVGGDSARLRMRKAARKALNRGTEGATNPSATQRGHWPESQAISQAWGPGYAQGPEYAAGCGAPMAYTGSPIPVYSGQPVAMGGHTPGYYGSPEVVPTSQTWVDEQ